MTRSFLDLFDTLSCTLPKSITLLSVVDVPETHRNRIRQNRQLVKLVKGSYLVNLLKN